MPTTKATLRRSRAILTVNTLHVHAGKEKKPIVRGLSLTVRPGEIHVIMGPNGSGKSTLASTLMGHPAYTVSSGSATFCGKNLLELSPEKRAQLGLFLAFQYPKEIAGVSLRNFLFAAVESVRAAREKNHRKLSPIVFQKTLVQAMKRLSIDPAFAERAVNCGFSGGEKKKAEILQMTLLKPRLALLDETDSGLDVDALKIVADGINALRGSDFSAIIVTHYARLLSSITPDYVHVMVRGAIVKSGGPSLAQELEKSGYAQYRERIVFS